MLLVFTEIIEINCFGMAKNSRRNILISEACNYAEIDEDEGRISIENFYLINTNSNENQSSIELNVQS